MKDVLALRIVWIVGSLVGDSPLETLAAGAAVCVDADANDFCDPTDLPQAPRALARVEIPRPSSALANAAKCIAGPQPKDKGHVCSDRLMPPVRLPISR